MLRTYIELQWKHSMQIFQVFETCACLLKNNNRQDQFFWATKNEQSKQTIFLRELLVSSYALYNMAAQPLKMFASFPAEVTFYISW